MTNPNTAPSADANLVKLRDIAWRAGEATTCRAIDALIGTPKERRLVHPANEAAAPEAKHCEAAAWKWGYEYLQHRMESIDRHGWAHDCDGEIEARIAAASAKAAPIDHPPLPEADIADEGSNLNEHFSRDALLEYEQAWIDFVAAPPAPPAPLPGKESERDFLLWAFETLIELNPSNYDHDDACACSAASVEVMLAIKKRVAALSSPPTLETAPEYRTGFDEAPSTFNQEDAAPADYLPSVSKEQALEALEDLDDFSRMTVGIAPTGQHATLRRFIEQSGRERVSADPLPRPLLTDLEIQGLRRQARNDPRCADQHWFILMVRAIESYYGVTGAAAQSHPLVEPTADTKPEICYSADGETFHEELSEIFHELDNDGALVVGGTYHQGEALRRTAGYYLQDIECLFERMGEVAYDEAGEHKGDWPDNSLKPGEADELKSLIRRWLDAHVKVWFYTVANVKEVAITEQDLIDYHGPQQHQVKKGEPS